ncbi:colorectal mutant cancer protein [Platysternon megacephalum]|uniref:Colorectal mutant cancer protein n=1 Tax=Platysternon megacephalum TaxID=55544 RepID=A0A4D9F504_9SAUR|nr:colorectal mutant cancer protein [Platysternon megacephalum]
MYNSQHWKNGPALKTNLFTCLYSAKIDGPLLGEELRWYTQAVVISSDSSHWGGVALPHSEKKVKVKSESNKLAFVPAPMYLCSQLLMEQNGSARCRIPCTGAPYDTIHIPVGG